MKKILSILLVLFLCFSFISPQPVYAAVKISKAKAKMEVDSTLQLNITGTKSTVVWKSSKKAVASVNKTGLVTAKAEGTAAITATISGKKYTCAVTVVDSNKIVEEKSLADLVEYLKSKDILSGKETKMLASLIGALSGVKYEDSNVELYEYDITSPEYKTLVKDKKIHLEDFDMDFPVSAINGKFILLCEYATNKQEIIEQFNSFE